MKHKKLNPLTNNLDNIVRWIYVNLHKYYANGNIDQASAVTDCKKYFANRGLGEVGYNNNREIFWEQQSTYLKVLIDFYSNKFETIFNSNKSNYLKMKLWRNLILDKSILYDLEQKILREVDEQYHYMYLFTRPQFRETFARARKAKS